MFSFHNYIRSYPLPCNISELNGYMCAGLSREGQLCGRCTEGFAPPSFSYSVKCVRCTEYRFNWIKYLGLAFGPLALFCLLICIFRISATSKFLFAFVFYCQIITMPTILRWITNTYGYQGLGYASKLCIDVYTSLMSIWNLDMGRIIYEPFCLHPRMTVVQTLAVDYLIGLYPLLLLLVASKLFALHSRSNRVVVTLWRPFAKLLRPFLQEFNSQTSLTEAFATLFFLSTMKKYRALLSIYCHPLHCIIQTVRSATSSLST